MAIRHLLLSLGLALTHSTIVTEAASSHSSGLKIDITQAVKCSRPSRAGDSIAVHYRGRLQSNNVEFDASYGRGVPFKFILGAGNVIKGWDMGLLDMCPGEKRTLTIPPQLGYGDRGVGPIPGGATLIFDTLMVEVMGVKQEFVSTVAASSSASASASTSTSTSPPRISGAVSGSSSVMADPSTMTTTEAGTLSIMTAPATPDEQSKEHEQADHANEHPGSTPSSPSSNSNDHLDTNKDKGKDPTEDKQAECQLLGPFALLVQAALGAVALLSLIWKRYRESPKRPWKIFIFDVSKQVLGSMLTHVLNLAMSMLGSVEIVNAAKVVATTASTDERRPNPCSFYLLNLAIDTTIGIPVLYVLLKLLTIAALRTPLARPPQSLKSGNYDRPPRTTWWLKQLLIYFLGLVGMKLFVLFLFKAMPWLPWIGDWALRWTRGNEALEITFAMFIFPLIMNGVQYWVIDSLIKENNKDGKGYEQVQGDTDEDDERSHLRPDHDDDDDDSAASSSSSTIIVDTRTTKAANPTPIPSYEHEEPHKSKKL